MKRQAVIEIQRAVAAAENRAIEAMAQERIKLEKMFTGLKFVERFVQRFVQKMFRCNHFHFRLSQIIF